MYYFLFISHLCKVRIVLYRCPQDVFVLGGKKAFIFVLLLPPPKNILGISIIFFFISYALTWQQLGKALTTFYPSYSH